MVDTNDEWIFSRTGIKERRIVNGGETLSDMGSEVVKEICKKRGISPLEIDMIIVGTVTRIINLNFSHHLSYDYFEMFIINFHTL